PTVSDDAPSPDDTTTSTTTPTITSTERDTEPTVSTPREVEQNDTRRSTTRQSATTQSRTQAKQLMEEGQALYEDGEPVEARAVLNTALSSGGLNERDAQDVRDLMAQINDTLIFSPRVDPDDPYVEAYEVQSGDLLSRIADRYDIPWQLAARINGNLDPRRIRVGQRLKMIHGPFHLVVHKRKYRLDVYLGDMYIRSFDVGLGEHDMTPVGEFIVRSPKLENPEWTNPRTGQRFLPDDPNNPLGGYWIGIKGTTPDTEVHTGYGIHGTIEPDSIGTDASMGCIRLLPKDVGQLYAMLTEDQSRVLVVE
ncbi:MAG: L,D-transpeptidase family protein, partial [Phycisphaeraceae bacterium]